MTFTTVEQKIAWEYVEACLRCSDFAQNSLKQLILGILSILQLSKYLEKFFFLQITEILHETAHNSKTFTTVEQKIAWQYVEACLRCSDFDQNSLKQLI